LTRIPEDVREEIRQRVERFNQEALPDGEVAYVPRFRGSYLYLDRREPMGVSHVCRLEYAGDVDQCAFAIYKYSSEKYAPDEWMFPGSEELDGTVEGAMRAGLIAYPAMAHSLLDPGNLAALAKLLEVKDPFEAPVQSGPAARTVGRNDPCPCGSGKKYKRCCGRRRRRRR
jgi:hypothetical protein